MSAFSTDVRILTCPHCGAPIQLARQGGQIPCGYCRAPLTIAARDDAPLQQGGSSLLSEPERIQGLWAQAASFGDKQLPPEMLAVLAGGALTTDRVGGALGVWRTYCQRASAGDFAAGELAVLMTGSISSYFAVVAKDLQRQRALFESTLDALRDPSHKQVVRCSLARFSMRAGDLPSAQVWFGACDPRSADLQADTAYRVTYASLATAHGDFRNVLAALGPAPGSIPVALPSRLHVGVLRANAVERSGDLATAIAQLVAEAQALPGGRQAIPEIAEASPHLQLCPQSIPLARMQW
ncbi:MAG: hypothetical protein KF819_05995 [Labilithrix sp.]|nr:hypothetical protein [Labilithrix sp.]